MQPSPPFPCYLENWLPVNIPYCVFLVNQRNPQRSEIFFLVFRVNAKSLFVTALPLTANRISLMLLHSIEAILIPRQLQLGGATSQEAFTVYGVFAGMALPMILFPNTLANAASVMLASGVAEDQAKGNHSSIKNTTKAATILCLLVGICAAIFFFLFGKHLGLLLFHNLQAGLFLQIFVFHQSVFVPQCNALRDSAWTWQNRFLLYHQQQWSNHSHSFCFICHSGIWDTGISVRHSRQRTAFLSDDCFVSSSLLPLIIVS